MGFHPSDLELRDKFRELLREVKEADHAYYQMNHRAGYSSREVQARLYREKLEARRALALAVKDATGVTPDELAAYCCA